MRKNSKGIFVFECNIPYQRSDRNDIQTYFIDNSPNGLFRDSHLYTHATIAGAHPLYEDQYVSAHAFKKNNNFYSEAPLTELASVFQGGRAIYFYIIKLECSMDIQSIKSNTMTQ
jgi:hypothetical protein